METFNFNQRGHDKTILTFNNKDVEKLMEVFAKLLKKKFATQIAYNNNGKHQFMLNGKFNPDFREITDELGKYQRDFE
jgi:translation initiation factor 2 beta subunit (eIF-2beta)/eIF-5